MSKLKRSGVVMASLALAAVLVSGGVFLLSTQTEAGTASYTMPFLTSHGNVPTYCVISNLNKGDNSTVSDNSTSDTTATFAVMATEKGGSSQTAKAIPTKYTPKSGFVRVLTFKGKGIYAGNDFIVDLSGELAKNSLKDDDVKNPMIYTGVLAVTSSTATCKTITISCMQGNPDGGGKRLIGGFFCDDGTNLVAY